MKKLNRKLIPAFAMLLLSAVLMSTASFAWFSSNGQVKASGMSVSATAPAALWISTANNTGFTTNITLTGAAKALTPATDDVAGFTTNTAEAADEWTFHALNTDGYALVKNDGTLKDETTLNKDNAAKYGTALTETNIGDYVFHQVFYLRLEGKNVSADDYDKMDLEAVITLNSAKAGAANDAIYKALRVAVVSDGASVLADQTKYTVGGYQVYAFESDFATDGKTVTGTKVDGEGSTKLMTIAAQETVAVHVYIWFEGNDTDCKNDNSNFVDSYSFDISFQKPTA